MAKIVVLAVTNDLTGDQRVHKVAISLLKAGAAPVLVGRRLPASKPLARSYQCIRFNLIFRKGPLFYLNYNVRLFWFLLFAKADIFVSNDLDTLAAVFLAGRLRGKKIVYDSHEYFTEVPELVNRKGVRRIWELLEQLIFPKLTSVYTVNQSIASIYKEKYGTPVEVIRNLPPASRPEPSPGFLPGSFDGHPIILYQGAVNVGRGLEEMIKAMELMPEMRLLIAGDGDIRKPLEGLVEELRLTEHVFFTGMVPFENLCWYTRQALIGISIEQDIGLNYRYALPNKLFDYMQAGLPVLASDLPEIKQVVEEAAFGKVVSCFEPAFLAETILEMTANPGQMQQWKLNAVKAFPKFTWEKQEPLLIKMIL
jgi:glycosyltransferase involved in cell wall biosynthesis